ncbi:MAG: hypothetical protein RLZZ545_1193 [Actinomycetota bacterium]|jgi:hypothetical protein
MIAWYLSYSATRLDRLHHRVETSWANLDGLLQRRAAIAIEIARTEISDPAASLLLTFAAHQARDANMRDRSQAESGLNGALEILLEGDHNNFQEKELELISELKDLNEKIEMGIAIHVDAVNRTIKVRKKPIIRLFRLAGSAPEPIVYEFEADVR